jgi:hypothetical protein
LFQLKGLCELFVLITPLEDSQAFHLNHTIFFRIFRFPINTRKNEKSQKYCPVMAWIRRKPQGAYASAGHLRQGIFTFLFIRKNAFIYNKPSEIKSAD